MWLLIFTIQAVYTIIAPDSSRIDEAELDRNSYIYSREYDEILYESNTSNTKLCDIILKTNYAKFLKSMSGDQFKPLIKDDLDGIEDSFCSLPKIQAPKKETSKSYNLITLEARCPTYLLYIRCIYANYIKTISSIVGLKPYTSDYLKYVDGGIDSKPRSIFLKARGGDLSFHIKQVLFEFCQFINHACPKLLESFSILDKPERQGWYKTFACSAFDYVNPIAEFKDLFDLDALKANSVSLDSSIKFELDSYNKFIFKADSLYDFRKGHPIDNILFTSIGAVYDTPLISQSVLNKYIFQYCVDLCLYLTRLSELKKYYSKEGLARFYFICAHRELDCSNICGACA